MDTERDDQQDYEPPDVKDLPAADGPAVTSADGSVGDASPPDGPEWRPTAPHEVHDKTP